MNGLDQGLDLAQPPGGYGPPPGGAPPGGWGPPPGGAPPGGWGPPPGGAPPGGWGPPPGGPPPGGGWGPPGGPPPGAPPGGAPPGGSGGWGPPGGPPGGAPPGAPGGGWGPPGGSPPGGYGQPPGGYGQPPGGPGAPGYPPGGGGYPGGPPPGFPGGPGGGAKFAPGDAITFAWERIKADPGTILATIIVGLIIVAIISTGISLIAQLIAGLAGAATTLATGAASRRELAVPALEIMGPLYIGLVGAGQIVSIIVSTFFTAGIMNFSLKVARGAPYAFGDLFSGAPFFLSMLAANFFIGLGCLLAGICLIVPAVILGLGLSMTMPLIIDRGLGPIDALKASWELTTGNKATIFIFALMTFGLAIAGMCACFVGILVVIPLVYIAYMYIYLKLSGQPVAQLGRAA